MSKGGTVTQSQSGRQNNSATSAFNNSQSNSSMIDPNSQAYVDWQRGIAHQAAGALGAGGPNAGMLNALGLVAPVGVVNAGYGQPDVGNFASQVSGLMNPYIQNVVDATKGQYDQLRGAASKDAAQQATLQGAFGGSRAAVTQGARLGQLDVGQANTIANLLQGGYNNAADQAFKLRDETIAGSNAAGNASNNAFNQSLQAAQFLFGANDRLRELSDPLQRYGALMGIANSGLGPYGQSSTASQSGSGTDTSSGTFNNRYQQQMPSNFWGNLLGAGLTIGGGLLGGPAGAGLASKLPGLMSGGATSPMGWGWS